MAVEPPTDIAPRLKSDRRVRPTGPLDAFRLRGRRARPRRVEERLGDYFTDRFEATTLVFIFLLLAMTIADGAITLLLLGADCEEINPAMRYLIGLGPVYFLIGKYILTSAGLPFLLIFRKVALFGTRFRVGHMIPIFVGLYVILLTYQMVLMRESY